MSEFTPFPKIPRLNRSCVITEKLDGTNASVLISPWTEAEHPDNLTWWKHFLFVDSPVYGPTAVEVGSRTRWITPQSDNFGFARWVGQNVLALVEGLGPGHHFGEWWGVGIQRGYDLSERRFSLFNTHRWTSPLNSEEGSSTVCNEAPCCHVVPRILHPPTLSSHIVKGVLDHLRERGSYAVPGYMKPEGVVVYHEAGKVLFKATVENDEQRKGEVVNG